MIKSLLEIYSCADAAICKYFDFDYTETWEEFVICDDTEYCWFLSRGEIIFSKYLITKELLDEGQYYHNEIISDEVYSKPDFTMIKVDTNTGGSCYLSILDNSKQITDSEIIEYYQNL